MKIFIDESGPFQAGTGGSTAISAVGALVIPSSKINEFETSYFNLRRSFPRTGNEVKGRELSEQHVVELVELLNDVEAILELSFIDLKRQSQTAIEQHRSDAVAGVTKHLTPQHSPTVIAQLHDTAAFLRNTSLPLYIQGTVFADVVYRTFNHASTYFAFREPDELENYEWIIDSKGVNQTTSWENWWSKAIQYSVQFKSIREPLFYVRGGDYRHLNKYKIDPDYLQPFIKKEDQEHTIRLDAVLSNFRFSSAAEPGLEAIDILTNAFARSLRGNFSRDGWKCLSQLMIHRPEQLVSSISLNPATLSRGKVAASEITYMNVIDDFRRGGRSIVPK